MIDATTSFGDPCARQAVSDPGRDGPPRVGLSTCIDPAVFCRETRRVAAHAFVVSTADIAGGGTCTRRISRARQVAMYLSNVAGGVALGQVGNRFGRDRRTVAHACAVVEDMRDDPDVDLALTMLEGALRAVFLFRAPGIYARDLPLMQTRRNATRHDASNCTLTRGTPSSAQAHGARRLARKHASKRRR